MYVRFVMVPYNLTYLHCLRILVHKSAVVFKY